jgi:hypothetical protein
VGGELYVGQVEYAGLGGQVTKWQRASTPEEVEAITGAWNHYGVLVEVLTNEAIDHLKAGGYLCVFQDEYGLVLRHVDAPLVADEVEE